MIEIPDVTAYLGRVLGLDDETATLATDLAAGPWRDAVEETYSTLAAALGVDEDRTRSFLFTVESMLRHKDSWSQNPNRLYLYFGPTDSRIRPFCFEHVGKVYSLGRIYTLDNGQLPDAFLTCGGWECRHHWMKLSEVSELRRFANTGERIPEVARHFAWLPHRPANDTAPIDSDEEPEGPVDPPWARWPKCPGPLRG